MSETLLQALSSRAADAASPFSTSIETLSRTRVFILAGQSNMVGRGDPSNVTLDSSVHLMYDNDGHFTLDAGAARATSNGFVPLQPQKSCWLKDDTGSYRFHLGPEVPTTPPAFLA